MDLAYGNIGMATNRLIALLLALTGLTLEAASPPLYPSFPAFLGTNGIVIRTNRASNFVQVDGANITNTFSFLSGSTNILQLSVQAAKLPMTNYPGIDAGWQDWELVYYETNAEGARVTLSSQWQCVIPPDYATNTMKLRIATTLLSTNGPNSSNTIFGVSFLRAASGSGVDLHTNLFGFTSWGTNTWAAVFDGTNKVQTMVIATGTNSALSASDVALIKISRDAANDTYGGATAVVGLQLEYTRP